jgi:hypothetical protein
MTDRCREYSALDQRSFLLQRAQPAMTGLIDGSLSTLAPIFAVAFAAHQPHDAFLAGLATATGRGSPYVRGGADAPADRGCLRAGCWPGSCSRSVPSI